MDMYHTFNKGKSDVHVIESPEIHLNRKKPASACLVIVAGLAFLCSGRQLFLNA